MNRVKLGKLAPRHDARTLRLAKYTAALQPPPESCDLTSKITSLGLMLNDQLGDCTCAAIGHIIQAWTAEDGAQVILPDPDILAAYSGACGYVPGNPATDQGGVELDVLNYWRKVGVGGHTIDAYAALQKRPANFWGKLFGASWRHDIATAVYYFGAAYIGVAQDAASWQLVSKRGDGAPGSWGGHAVPILAYDEDGVTVATWGTLMKASWEFIDEYADEAFCCFAKDIVGPDGKSPQGFASTQLETDLNEVTA